MDLHELNQFRREGPLRLTVKNYRGYSDKRPLRIDLRRGLTAFVGPNNSGKSTILRFFYEMRQVLSHAASVVDLSQSAMGNVWGVAYTGVSDPVEVFCNQNDRNLEILIEFGDEVQSGPKLESVTMTCQRRNPTNWSATANVTRDGQLSELTFAGSHSDMRMFGDGIEAAVPADDLDLLRSLARHSMYVGAFRNAITEGSAKYFDLTIGSGFIAEWNEWKTGNEQHKIAEMIDLTKQLRDLFGFKTLEINSANNNTALQCIIDGKAYRIGELGSGFAQFLVILANVVVRRPRVLLIDEPEGNLHSRLQSVFLMALAEKCDSAVLYSTHSLGLARTTADRVYGCAREDGGLRVAPFEDLLSLPLFAGEMGLASYHDLGNETILLVEGATDPRLFQTLLRKRRKDHRVVAIPLGGSDRIRAGVTAEIHELKRLCPRVVAVIDSEKDGPGASLSRDRECFRRECGEIGVKVVVLARRATENYLSDRAIKRVFGKEYRALKEYELISDLENRWRKSDSWKAALEMEVEELAGSDLGELLDAL